MDVGKKNRKNKENSKNHEFLAIFFNFRGKIMILQEYLRFFYLFL